MVLLILNQQNTVKLVRYAIQTLDHKICSLSTETLIVSRGLAATGSTLLVKQ